jgi:hypothetical protein
VLLEKDVERARLFAGSLPQDVETRLRLLREERASCEDLEVLGVMRVEGGEVLVEAKGLGECVLRSAELAYERVG